MIKKLVAWWRRVEVVETKVIEVLPVTEQLNLELIEMGKRDV